MILLIDNYDSFTYNVKHYLLDLGEKVTVFRNDDTSIKEIRKLKPRSIVISPGPCTPKEAGISVELVQDSQVPLLGVCLGHQSIGAAFGAKIVKAPNVFHGKKSEIRHSNSSLLYKGIPDPYSVVRYHSLIIDNATLPKDLRVTSSLIDDPNIIMGVEHISRPIYGVQFHPESIDTQHGMKLISNFLNLWFKNLLNN